MTNPAARCGMALGLGLAAWTAAAFAAPHVIVAVRRGDDATPQFALGDAPAPSATDAANAAAFRLLAGSPDGAGAGLECLNDGRLPAAPDEPRSNFFFAAGTPGGRLLIDLGQSTPVRQVNTYSWHPTTRGPQVYRLFAAPEGEAVDLEAVRDGDPAERGWRLLAAVDTREAAAGAGGQFGVSVGDDAGGVIAATQYLLLLIDRTESDDPFGNTFYSEIDVVDGREHPPASRPAAPQLDLFVFADGYAIEFDLAETPELKPWVDETLKPVCAAWYPKIVALLPGDDYTAPRRFHIAFRRDMPGVAHCAGTQIECAGRWFAANLDGEAAGAIVHEMVHVVQQYGGGRRGRRNPGWLVEGLADYIRWFLYEPESLRPRVDPERARYTDSYRTTGAFLDFVVRTHGEGVIAQLNASMRRGEYRPELWSELTGRTVDDLWAEFVAELRAPADAQP